jgi:hypothetical protein
MPAGKTTPNPVDAYIAKAPEHFRPICRKLRELIRAAGPEWEETMRWSQPAYRGKGLVCLFGAFKHHVRLIFFRELSDPDHVLAQNKESASGHGLKIVSESDIPVAKLKRLLRKPRKSTRLRRRRASQNPAAPSYRRHLTSARRWNVRQRPAETFDRLSPSCRREYIEWISSAKRAETRERRIGKAMDLLESGQRMGEKYR